MSKLIIAIPSKGRLQENTQAFFEKLDLKLKRTQGARGYRGTLKGLDNVEIAFLSASEIAKALDEGMVHLGVTGEDLLRENILNADEKIEILNPLGFGHANVIVAVPQSWIDVNVMQDLDEVANRFRDDHGRRLRIATKYNNLTANFFAKHGIENYRLVASAGATEGAPAAGSAELIVDITSTGSTLAANNLKILSDGVILRSQANLTLSYTADWDDEQLLVLEKLLNLTAAEQSARQKQEINCALNGLTAGNIQHLVDQLGCILPFGDKAQRLTLVADKTRVFEIVDYLKSCKVDYISVSDLKYIFNADHQQFAQIKQKLLTK